MGRGSASRSPPPPAGFAVGAPHTPIHSSLPSRRAASGLASRLLTPAAYDDGLPLRPR
jgi:hypothetical protein